MDKIIFINFHGIFDLSYEDLKENLRKLDEHSIKNFGTKEIYINKYKNYISIYHPIFSSCTLSVEHNLIVALEELENSLVEGNSYSKVLMKAR